MGTNRRYADHYDRRMDEPILARIAGRGRAAGQAMLSPRGARWFRDRTGSLNTGRIRAGESVARNTGEIRPALRVLKDHYFLD